MADTKQDVLDMLRDLAELTMLEEGDPQSFRVRAYESAAQAIAAQATDLGKLTIKELQQIEGIGKSTADKIRELLETGRVQKLETLREKEMYRVERTWVVSPEDVSVLDPTPTRSLTLVTCYPFYHVGPAPQRFIVRAGRVERK